MATKGTFTDHKDAVTDANGQVLYGMDKELAEKAAAKYDPELEKSCKVFVEALSGLCCHPTPPHATKRHQDP